MQARVRNRLSGSPVGIFIGITASEMEYADSRARIARAVDDDYASGERVEIRPRGDSRVGFTLVPVWPLTRRTHHWWRSHQAGASAAWMRM